MIKKISICLILCIIFSVSCFAAEVTTIKDKEGWQLLVDDRPFFVKGTNYTPTAVGESSNDNTRRYWMRVDDDNDGRNDYAYQTWVDVNRNGKRDSDEKEIGDFELMRQMGVNTIRIYHHVSSDPELQEINSPGSQLLNGIPNKELLRELHKNYGIWVAMGDLVGAYGVSSGASWEEGTDYTDSVQRENMLKSIRDMVLTHKDEPYLLMWILGNENNLKEFTKTKAIEQKQDYAEFVNEAALLIKSLDGHHPIALCNGGFTLLEEYAQYAPDIDIFGINLYRNYGFGELWKKVDYVYDRPVLLTEFGTMRAIVKDGVFNEKYQSKIHQRSWEDISKHRYQGASPGNSIGGFIFSWVDEWWGVGDKRTLDHNQDGGNWGHEYYGISALLQDNGKSLGRQLRETYRMYQQQWNKEKINNRNQYSK